MEEIDTIYYNKFGITFHWKRINNNDLKKIQIVFRNTGLLLTNYELKALHRNIEFTIKNVCKSLKNKNSREFILQTNAQTSFSMSYKELSAIKDLVKGTLTQLELHSLLKEVNINQY